MALPPVTTPSLPPLVVSQPASAIKSWTVGQTLQAVVTSAPSQGQATLQIGNLTVQAQTPIPLQAGQKLSLQVASLETQPLLKIINQAAADPVSAAIRTVLPRQAPITPLMANLPVVAQPARAGAAAPNMPIPPIVGEAARQLFQRLPDSGQVSTATGLQKAVADSGLFMEARIAHRSNAASTPAIASTDVKANLIKLLQVLRNWPGLQNTARPAGHTGTAPTTAGHPSAPGTALPPQPGALPGAQAQASGTTAAALQHQAAGIPLRGMHPRPQAPEQADLARLQTPTQLRDLLLSQVESSLSRVQLHQLASLPTDAEARGAEWLMELPVRRGDQVDVWSLRIKRDGEDSNTDDENTTAQWSVTLAFQLDNMGPIQARIALRGEQVSTTFWATEENTATVLQTHLNQLHHQLQQAGLDVDNISCHRGSMPTPTHEDNNANRRILEDKA